MRFDSATFSFLDLLLIKSYKNQKRKILKEQFQIAHKKQCSKPFLSLLFLLVANLHNLQDVKGFVRQ